jgi:hypothetical protein
MAYNSATGMDTSQMGMPMQDPRQVNPNQMVPSPINPKAFGAPQAIAGIYGQANPDTFTRSVDPQAPMPMDGPVPVPTAIQDQSQITPNQGFNNL